MIQAIRLFLNDNDIVYISQESQKLDDYTYSKSVFVPIVIKNNSVPCKLEYAEDMSIIPNSKQPFEINELESGVYNLRLKETLKYVCRCKLKNEDGVLSIPNQDCNKFLKYSYINKENYSFTFVNYLGLSRLKIGKEIEFPFEVVPTKMNYEEDYIALTESLAEKCSSLLLDYSGITYSTFSQTAENSNTLLEQFIFLRQFCYSDNIESLFESIKRNPDRLLVQEDILEPFGLGIPSAKFYSNPFSYSRNWNKVEGTEEYFPSEVAVTHKYDSLNTPANSFIKFALTYFYEICQKLSLQLSTKNSNDKQTECYFEAQKISEYLDTILQDSFFDDVADLGIMPDNNQVLQKREGYAQIFNAFNMVDLALKLDWKGKDEIYKGEAKNIALLYEYWLFFELYNIINSIQKNPLSEYENDELAKQSGESFCISKDSGLIISLKEGDESCQYFEINKYNTKINLYYNKTFSPKEFSTTEYEGSYSRPFRPDYTLAVFPSEYPTEKDAINEGEVSYIHFDAKYRITDLSLFMNNGESIEDENREVEQEKIDSITNTYQRGDLLKMHTYNDAIRRTIGSYVLYPGDESTKTFCLYEEILPGVGAFAIRPSIKNSSENELKKFIEQLVEAKSMNYSRLSRVNYFNNTILQEPTIKITEKNKKQSTRKKICVLGYIRNDNDVDYYPFLERNSFLQVGKEFFFYYYAIKDGYVYSHHKDIAKAKCFKFYTNKISKSETYEIEPYECSIETNELVSKVNLVEKLVNLGYETQEAAHHADFYFLIKVKVTRIIDSQSIAVHDLDSVNGNDTFSAHSPKVINV